METECIWCKTKIKVPWLLEKRGEAQLLPVCDADCAHDITKVQLKVDKLFGWEDTKLEIEEKLKVLGTEDLFKELV